VQYSGLKYADDDTDAAWLAKLLRLGLLPEGISTPRPSGRCATCCVGASLVQQHTANILAVQNLFSRNRGRSISANEVRRLTPESVAELVADPNLALAIQSTVLVMRGQQAAIDLLEREAWRQTKETPHWRALQSVSGIGRILGLTILLETGPIERFARRQLRLLLPLCRQHARLQRQAEGQGQHQERQQVPRLGVRRGGQLRRALQPADQALLSTQARQDQGRGRDQGGRPQAGTRLLPHSARRQRVRREPRLRVNRIGHASVSLERGWRPATRSD
jgi:hypothetical protein